MGVASQALKAKQRAKRDLEEAVARCQAHHQSSRQDIIDILRDLITDQQQMELPDLAPAQSTR